MSRSIARSSSKVRSCGLPVFNCPRNDAGDASKAFAALQYDCTHIVGAERGAEFERALVDMQRRGIAEADPH